MCNHQFLIGSSCLHLILWRMTEWLTDCHDQKKETTTTTAEEKVVARNDNNHWKSAYRWQFFSRDGRTSDSLEKRITHQVTEYKRIIIYWIGFSRSALRLSTSLHNLCSWFGYTIRGKLGGNKLNSDGGGGGRKSQYFTQNNVPTLFCVPPPRVVFSPSSDKRNPKQWYHTHLFSCPHRLTLWPQK